MEQAKQNRLEERKLKLMVSELQDAEAAAAGGQSTGRSRDRSTSRLSTLKTSRVGTSEDTTGEGVGLRSATPSSTSDSSNSSSTGKQNFQESTLATREPSTISSSGEIFYLLSMRSRPVARQR